MSGSMGLAPRDSLGSSLQQPLAPSGSASVSHMRFSGGGLGSWGFDAASGGLALRDLMFSPGELAADSWDRVLRSASCLSSLVSSLCGTPPLSHVVRLWSLVRHLSLVQSSTPCVCGSSGIDYVQLPIDLLPCTSFRNLAAMCHLDRDRRSGRPSIRCDTHACRSDRSAVYTQAVLFALLVSLPSLHSFLPSNFFELCSRLLTVCPACARVREEQSARAGAGAVSGSRLLRIVINQGRRRTDWSACHRVGPAVGRLWPTACSGHSSGGGGDDGCLGPGPLIGSCCAPDESPWRSPSLWR